MTGWMGPRRARGGASEGGEGGGGGGGGGGGKEWAAVIGVCWSIGKVGRGQEESSETGGGEFVFSLRRQVGWEGRMKHELRRTSDRDAAR